MNYLDWIVIAVYLCATIGLALYLGRRLRDRRDYYLAANTIKWWQSGLSTMATQLGAISFVSAPAFVAVARDGGLKWLCYELGVPLGIILVMAVILPKLHRRGYVSIYEYLEQRFDRGVRILVSTCFQIGRSLATAVSVLAGGIILSTALSISTDTAILLIGSITIVYSVLGGIRTIIISDVLQMGIIIGGILICGFVGMIITGGDIGWELLDPARREILDFSHFGLRAGETYAFWPMLVGGLFLYASYYGCDQSQVQRELSVHSLNDARKSLVLNAVGRFPIVLLYCIMGVLIGAVVMSPSGLVQIADTVGMGSNELLDMLHRDPDRMIPVFVLSFLPNGLIGFVFVAVMAALMSSLDSAINSLSAVTVQDFYKEYVNDHASERTYLFVSRIATLGWGVFCIFTALVFAGLSEGNRETTDMDRPCQVFTFSFASFLSETVIGDPRKRMRTDASTTNHADMRGLHLGAEPHDCSPSGECAL